MVMDKPDMKNLAKCPKCQQQKAKKVPFTWWGGALGPRLLHHVQCTNCAQTYNGRTGKTNTIAIVMYLLIMIVVMMFLINEMGVFL